MVGAACSEGGGLRAPADRVGSGGSRGEGTCPAQKAGGRAPSVDLGLPRPSAANPGGRRPPWQIQEATSTARTAAVADPGSWHVRAGSMAGLVVGSPVGLLFCFFYWRMINTDVLTEAEVMLAYEKRK